MASELKAPFLEPILDQLSSAEEGCIRGSTRDSRFASFLVHDGSRRLEHLAQKNFHLAVFCLIHVGINVVCAIVNGMDARFREDHALGFHLSEFWSAFCFSVVQVYALVYSPSGLGAPYSSPLVLKAIVSFNIISSFVPAALVSISLEAFEVIAHEIEYINEIGASFIDLVQIAALMAQAGRHTENVRGSLVMAVLALFVASVQLSIYNLWHPPVGEQMAHYFEFTFEILSGAITFLFCLDNMFVFNDRERRLARPRREAEACRAPGNGCGAAAAGA